MSKPISDYIKAGVDICTAYAAISGCQAQPADQVWICTPRRIGNRGKREVIRLDAGRPMVQDAAAGVDAEAADALLAEAGWARVDDWDYAGDGLWGANVVRSEDA
jgi:hypothetical protein